MKHNVSGVIFRLTIFALALFLIICGCGRRKPVGTARSRSAPPATVQENREQIEAKFEEASISWDDGHGNRLFEAKFEEAVASQVDKSAVAELRGAKATLYRQGKPVSTLIAPRITADSTRKEVTASGGATVVSAENESSASAQRLVWNAGANRVTGSGAVRMKRGNMSIRAKSFEADTALKKAKFVDGEMNLK